MTRTVESARPESPSRAKTKTLIVRELPLFPLQAVLFPGARLTLQVFEARYLDLMSRCLRDGSDFGIVHIVEGQEVRRPGDADPTFAPVGTTVRIAEVDMPRAGLMLVALEGRHRFRLGAVACKENGLWTTQATDLPDDAPLAPKPEHAALVDALRKALAHVESQRGAAAIGETRFDDAGWVANRWCELLPLDMPSRQVLLELDHPLDRLEWVDRIVRSRAATH